MGKNKHKKHHRHGEGDDGTDGEGPRPSGLKLILKVGSVPGGSRDKHKKKKKKKEKKKDRDRHDRESSKKDRHHKKHHRHSSDKRDKHAALEMLKSGDLQVNQSHIPTIALVTNPNGNVGNSVMHNDLANSLTTNQTGLSKVRICIPSNYNTLLKKQLILIILKDIKSHCLIQVPVSVDGNMSVNQIGMTGLPNAAVSAPPSVVITPKVETAAIKTEDGLGEKKQPNTNLSRFLEYLLKLLQKKDSNSFFAIPVNDQYAPGYSQIIKTPMDFSTMRSKVSR